MYTFGDNQKIVWYRVAMNEKRNRKRHTVYIAHSMIMQRSSIKPMRRRREFVGRMTWDDRNRPHRFQRPSAPQMATTKRHRPTPYQGPPDRQWQTQLCVAADSTNSSPINEHSIVNTNQHRTASTVIEVQYLYTDYTV